MQNGYCIFPMQNGYCIFPMQNGYCILPMQNGYCILPMQNRHCILPMQNRHCILPMQNTFGKLMECVAARKLATDLPQKGVGAGVTPGKSARKKCICICTRRARRIPEERTNSGCGNQSRGRLQQNPVQAADGPGHAIWSQLKTDPVYSRSPPLNNSGYAVWLIVIDFVSQKRHRQNLPRLDRRECESYWEPPQPTPRSRQGHKEMQDWTGQVLDVKQWNTVQYNTIQLYCLYVEKFAFWLVIYIKTFNTINNKTSTTQ